MSNSKSGWIGVDLDGTLAHYCGWQGLNHIGDPIIPMVERVKRWISTGTTVKIFTARVQYHQAPITGGRYEDAITPIQIWCLKHIGFVLEITNVKDFGMIELWDDRAVQVITNTGLTLQDMLIGSCPTSGEPDPQQELDNKLNAAFNGLTREERDDLFRRGMEHINNEKADLKHQLEESITDATIAKSVMNEAVNRGLVEIRTLPQKDVTGNTVGKYQVEVWHPEATLIDKLDARTQSVMGCLDDLIKAQAEIIRSLEEARKLTNI